MSLNCLELVESKNLIFLTGFSGAGKSTIADRLVSLLPRCSIVDGDKVREVYGGGLPHGIRGLEINTQRLIDLSLRFFESNDYVISAFVAPREELRNRVRLEMLSKGIRFIEVYVCADLMTCSDRDPKGLYKRLKEGEDIRLAGLNEVYEIPESPDLTCNTKDQSLEENVNQIISYVEGI